MKIVFALGGSVVNPDGIDEEYVRAFANFAKELAKKHKLGIVIGGGRLARRKIEEARKKGANQSECDYIGIDASRYNASVVSQAMGMAPHIPESLKDARRIMDDKGIVIMGGTEPGHSTDAVAVILAEYANADMVFKVTDVPGIYDKDPQKFKDAKMFKELAIGQLEKMVVGLSQEAGKYELVDIVAVEVLKRSGVKMIALDGHDLDNINHAIDGKSFVGTVIR